MINAQCNKYSSKKEFDQDNPTGDMCIVVLTKISKNTPKITINVYQRRQCYVTEKLYILK